MRTSLAPAYWHYFFSEGVAYPSAAGLSVSHIVRIEIYPAPVPLPAPPLTVEPRDLNGDGRYEDVNGNGQRDFAEIVLYFNQMTWIAANEPIKAFDYNANGQIEFADVRWLFETLG